MKINATNTDTHFYNATKVVAHAWYIMYWHINIVKTFKIKFLQCNTWLISPAE